ncbi:MAG: glycerol-3-phosphate responsive antiterminator [Clostridia bacterium]|nr:glycerol-3-phosphate responsive antiterminator [Clostridia bacterium]
MQFDEQPIIAAVRDEEGFHAACDSPCHVIFLLNANIFSLPPYATEAHAKGKKVFLHVDLAEGVGKDACGIKFVQKCGVDGIITTRSSLIKQAKECGIACVQRFFMVDSHSVTTALDSIRSAAPDMIEIMPGTLGKTIRHLAACTSVPIIAGGMLETKEEIVSALSAGASAVSTGKKELWSL